MLTLVIFLPFLFLGTVVIAAVCIGVGRLFRPEKSRQVSGSLAAPCTQYARERIFW